jgi:hypothetical protein
MYGLIHPITKAVYEQDGEGNVRVRGPAGEGIFTMKGRWLRGEIREADPQMCGWIAGPLAENHRLASARKAAALANKTQPNATL